VSFKAAIGSRQAFLPARAPMATPARQMRVMAKGPRLGQKNNIAKVNQQKNFCSSAFAWRDVEYNRCL
jgi:hypothetical protein